MIVLLLLGIVLKVCSEEIIYQSHNLSDYFISIEPNPGGGSDCVYDILDVGLEKFSDYIEVTSNVNKRNVYVNAIAGKKYIENLPSGRNISLGRYYYENEFRLKVIPEMSISQEENGQVISSLIQIYDGRNELLEANFYTLEFAYIHVLNRWEPDYGKIMVYTGFPLDLADTGIRLEPDLEWHKMGLAVDFGKEKYSWIEIDDQFADISHVDWAKVDHHDWRNDSRVALTITVESLATWPGYTCTSIFCYTVQFRNSKFVYLGETEEDDDNHDEIYNSQVSVFNINQVTFVFIFTFFVLIDLLL